MNIKYVTIMLKYKEFRRIDLLLSESCMCSVNQENEPVFFLYDTAKMFTVSTYLITGT